ncbi:MAG: SAM-dependent methyltransferase [Pseudonocardiaceae bacterium]
MDPVATTGLYTAMLRARESTRPDRLFSDPFAEVLAGPQGNDVLALMEAGSSGGSQNPVIPIRTRFFDDALERIVGELGVDQLVILAAGMDTRAFRLSLPPDLALFELDRPEVLDLKASRLAQVNAAPCCQRVPLPVDLTGDWSATLQGGGFDRQRPSAWLVEGLTPYLTDDQVHHLLGTLSELAVAGSWLLADVIGHSFLTSPRLAGFRAMMAASGSPFRFGTDDPEGLMGMHGWRPQVSRFDEAGANFGRWILPATYREDPHLPHGYLIVAHR